MIVPFGTLELIKWVALVAMTLDHVGAYFFPSSLWMRDLGRMSMPLFMMVFGCHLGRLSHQAWIDQLSHFKRYAIRMALIGLVAAPIWASLYATQLGSSHLVWLPANIMFTMLLVLVVYILFKKPESNFYRRSLYRFFALCSFLVLGAYVDYAWPAVMLGLALASWGAKRTWLSSSAVMLACCTLVAVNGTHWALLSLPIILMAPMVTVNWPRCGRFFYYFYPAHIAVIWLILEFKSYFN